MDNHVDFRGRFSQNPEQRQTQNGKMMVTFEVASRKPFGKNGDDPNYFHCICWGNVADYVAKYGAVGKEVAVHGSLEFTIYTDRNGNKQRGHNLLVHDVDIRFSESNNMENPQNQNGQQQPQGRAQPSGGYGNGQRQQPNGGGYSQNNNGYRPQNNGYGNNGYSQPAAPDFMEIPNGMDDEIPFN